jgi:hypothetical protein
MSGVKAKTDQTHHHHQQETTMDAQVRPDDFACAMQAHWTNPNTLNNVSSPSVMTDVLPPTLSHPNAHSDNWSVATTVHACFAKQERTTMSKTPNLVQRPTGPTIYPAMRLPPMVNVPKTIDPGLAQLGRIKQPAPQPKPVK